MEIDHWAGQNSPRVVALRREEEEEENKEEKEEEKKDGEEEENNTNLPIYTVSSFLLQHSFLYQQTPGTLLTQVLVTKNAIIFVSDKSFGLVDPNHRGQDGTVTVDREWWTSSSIIPISYETSFRGVSVELCHISSRGLSHGDWLTVICNQLHWKDKPLEKLSNFWRYRNLPP